MKYHTVYLYDVKYNHPYRGQTILATAEPIIVKKGLFSVTELLTGQKIEIMPRKARDKFGVVTKRRQKKEEAERTGYHLVVLEEELTDKYLTTPAELDEYVSSYDNSEYKTIYESIKEKIGNHNEKSDTVKQKVKINSKTKK